MRGIVQQICYFSIIKNKIHGTQQIIKYTGGKLYKLHRRLARLIGGGSLMQMFWISVPIYQKVVRRSRYYLSLDIVPELYPRLISNLRKGVCAWQCT